MSTSFRLLSGFAGWVCAFVLLPLSSPREAVAYQSVGDGLPDIPSGYMIIEGDIIVPEDFFTRGTYATNIWPGGVVPYHFDAAVTPQNQTRTINAMREWEKRALVDFRPYVAGDVSWITIRNASVNSSSVGAQGGEQFLNMQDWGAHYVIVHELGHALGLWHEQSRTDRNQYVQIHYENICQSCCSSGGGSCNDNFDIRPSPGGEFGLYDFDSLMHYDNCAFSVACLPDSGCLCPPGTETITVLPPHEQWDNYIGQRWHVSDGDADVMATLYGRDADCNGNFIRDGYDLADGTSDDANSNGVPDECEAVRLYVKADAAGLNRGTSWTHAYTSLQRALNVARNSSGVTEIWVTQGTYRPALYPEKRLSFILRNGLALLGGFPNFGNPTLADRNPNAFVSTLSGDLAGNDSPTNFAFNEPTRADNVFHVVTASGVNGTAVLDGFTIRSGNAQAATFADNSGGGMYLNASAPIIRNCNFIANSSFGRGGSVYCNAASNATFVNCRFENGRANDDGGAIANSSSSPTFINCTFLRNASPQDGGAMYNNPASDPLLSGCRFELNAAENGGAIFNLVYSRPTILNSVFVRNSASRAGGAIHGEGGGVHPSISNSTFVGNTADLYGGAVFTAGASEADVSNCTFSGNRSNNHGGAVFVSSDAIIRLRNSILWGNAAPQGPQFRELDTGDAMLTYCDVQGGGGQMDLDPLFITNPSPGQDGNWGTPDDIIGDLRLRTGSPCIDAGDNFVAPTASIDLGRAHRYSDDPATPDTGNGPSPVIDLGAYEFDSPLLTRVHVRTGAAGMNNGISWTHAFTELRAALATIRLLGIPSCDVWVGAGTHTPAVPGGSRLASFDLASGVSLYGGFAGTETLLSQRGVTKNSTVLSGDLNGDDGPTVAWDDPTRQDNSYHVLRATYATSTARLDGFVVRDGNASAATFPENGGGGLYAYASSPTIANCTFLANCARGRGGAIYNDKESNSTFAGSTFTLNVAGDDGGAMANFLSNPRLTQCAFLENLAASDGGACFNHLSSFPAFVRCSFGLNRAENDGGALYSTGNSFPSTYNGAFLRNRATRAGGASGSDGAGTTPAFVNCTFVGNTATLYGGALFASGASAITLSSCTLTANESDNHGGGIFASQSASANVQNTVVWGNSAPLGPQIQLFDGGSATLSSSHVQDWPGPGSVPAPLYLRNPAKGTDGVWGTSDDDLGDLHLQELSPCIDAGNDVILPLDPWDIDGDGVIAEKVPLDFDDAPRVTGCRVDIGADETVFTGGAPHSGDMNASGSVTVADIPAFVAVLLTGVTPGQVCAADMNSDGLANGLDIRTFVDALIP